MEKVTFFFKSGQFLECANAQAIELAILMLTYCACDLIVITDKDGTVYPIELTQMFKAF